ncbi:MAG: A/G-specific adenine glycosylase [Candidatus Bipolaricaulota bacterium]|nr:MAG: A/G-specific adenine glycosylase [Candidatus Bipolaricaulota bacterium]
MVAKHAALDRLREALLSWYRIEARDLPWRATRDPYAVWVSEIMLQQTRVETVLAYYDRFLKRFPTVESLAAASLDEVLKAWEGLGYYRRARNLHRAAGGIVEHHAGRIPRSVSELRALPGIGAYTAGAIASIAFGREAPALDGNIIRVLSRLFRVSGDPQRAATRDALLEIATGLVKPGNAGQVNQALMDLGARLCRPRSPRCASCPAASSCAAHKHGEEALYPQRPRRKAIPLVHVVAGIVWDREPQESGAKLLIAKRHEDDMLGGLWEFPGGRIEDGESHEEALARELCEELGIEVEIGECFMELDHAYTHFRVSLYVYECRHTHGRPRAIDCADWAWVLPEDLDGYAFPVADRRILDRLVAS